MMEVLSTIHIIVTKPWQKQPKRKICLGWKFQGDLVYPVGTAQVLEEEEGVNTLCEYISSLERPESRPEPGVDITFKSLPFMIYSQTDPNSQTP